MKLRRPSPAMVVALIALVMSMTGGAIADRPVEATRRHRLYADHGLQFTEASPPQPGELNLPISQ